MALGKKTILFAFNNIRVSYHSIHIICNRSPCFFLTYMPGLDSFQSEKLITHFRKMVHCCIIGCDSSSEKNPTAKYHTIPNETDKRSRWIEQISNSSGLRNGKWLYSTRICGLHFTQDSYSFTGRLFPYAVPTLFGRKRRRIEDGKK